MYSTSPWLSHTPAQLRSLVEVQHSFMPLDPPLPLCLQRTFQHPALWVYPVLSWWSLHKWANIRTYLGIDLTLCLMLQTCQTLSIIQPEWPGLQAFPAPSLIFHFSQLLPHKSLNYCDTRKDIIGKGRTVPILEGIVLFPKG